jgi:hypothetical protein
MNLPRTNENSPSTHRRFLNRVLFGCCLFLATLIPSLDASGQGDSTMEDFLFDYHLGTAPEGGPMHEFDIEDRQNRFLTLEESTNLTDWTEIGSFKVTNTDALVAHAPLFPGHPHVFYRINYDSTNQIPNDETNILDLPATPFNYTNFPLPAHLLVAAVQNQDNTPATNPTTDAGASLGRVLFY